MPTDLGTRCLDALRRLHQQGRIASPWMAGMLAVFSDGTRERYELGDGPWTYGDRCPDFTDPATLGCLLALVREAHGDVIWLHYYCGVWVVCGLTRCLGEGATEAEALVVALESAP